MALCGGPKQTMHVANTNTQVGDLDVRCRGNEPRRNWGWRGIAGHLQIIVFILLGLFINEVPLHSQTAHFSGAQVTLAYTGFDSYGQVAVDTSGNVFFVDALAGAVKEIVAAGGYATVKPLGGGFIAPQGVAVDVSGNVFVADAGNYGGAAVKKIPPNCVASSCVITLGSGFSFYQPTAVAVDGSGNVFVADLIGTVYEIPATGSVKTLGDGFSTPQGVAVDGSGNVFVAETGYSAVREIPVGCTTSGCVKTLGGGFSYPQGVAVDGSGNVFVADTLNNAIKEIPANCATSSCVKSLGTGFESPFGLAVDGSGNVYAQGGFSPSLVKLETGTVDFGTLAVGKTSAAISLTFTFDSGGSILILPTSQTQAEFSNTGAGSCATGTYYSTGQTCMVTAAFTPASAGLRTGKIYILSSTSQIIATASLQGTGTGTGGTVSTTTNLTSSLNPSTYGQSVTITATVAATSGTTTPTGTVQFSVDGSSVGSAVTLSGGTAAYTTSTLAAGTHSFTAAYTPSTGSSFTASSASAYSQVVNKITPAVTVTPSSSSIATTQVLSVTIAVGGGTGNPTPTGSVTLKSGSYTSAATTLVSGSTTISIPAGSLTVGAATLTATYTPDSSSSSTYTSAAQSSSVTVTNTAKTTPNMTVTPSLQTITTAQALTVAVAVSGTPTPTGTVTFTSYGYTSASIPLVSGGASIVIPAGSLASGIDTLTVTYTPDSNSAPTYNTATQTCTVTVNNPGKSTPTVTVAPSSSGITTAQALSVTIGIGGTPTPTGTAALVGGGYTSAATTLTGGNATIIIPAGSLATGSYTLTASYTPDSTSSSIYSSATGTMSVTVNTPGTGTGPQSVFVPGLITTVAGNGTWGYNSDGIAATSAELNKAYGAAVDNAGNIFIADLSNSRIRKVSASTGLISTVAGNGTAGYNGDGIVATTAELNQPSGVMVDNAGNIYIAEYSGRIRKVSGSTGLISTVAGNGTSGYNGDGIAATSAEVAAPENVAMDSAGNIYIAEFAGRIRKVSSSTGLISTVAGNGTWGYNGDGIAATSAEINAALGVAVDGAGNIYIADEGNNRVRKVSASTGLISTVAGNGTSGYNGDGIAASSAELTGPTEVAVDSVGNIFIADAANNRIRRVSSSTGLISTVAGNGTNGYNSDGIAATNATLALPEGIAVDSAGNIFIADYYSARIRKVGAGISALSFATTAVGSTSSDSPQTVTIWNNGTTPLAFSIPSSGNNPRISSNFTLNSSGGTACPLVGSTASSAGTLAVGASCTLSISFAPTAAGSLSGSLALTDNNLNVPNATQAISLTGTATGGTVSTTPAVTVTPSASSITTAQTLSVTVAVSGGAGKATATGSVILSGGGYTSTATTLNSGSATINIPAGSLATGADTLTASYTPDSSSSSTYNTATGSTSVTVTTIVSASFTVSGTAAAVAKGATTANTSTITVAPTGGFTGSVALTAAVMSSPSGAQYPPTLSFGTTSPVSITGTTAGTATLTISTTAATSAALYHPERPGVPWYAAGGTTLACLLLFGIPARHRSWRTILGMLVFLVFLTGGVLSCGGGSGGIGGGGGTSISGTTSGAYTLTVTGTSGSTTSTGTVTLTVQ
jgi:sugar lactone lactonase YvrE